jgi:ABC-2 type transport system ATP-binding protein
VSLEIDHVTKRYGATTALDGLSFEVARGEVFGFLGANGAGKTTTMRICLGIIRADAGEIRWEGQPTAELPRRTWGYLPEERGLYARMGVLDQLVYFASLYGQPPDRARREGLAWLARFHISDYADRRAEELSKGNQQKVQFIAAVLHGPEVLLMDEPFTGLDPVNLVLLREAFMELRDQGRTLIFSTHQMELAEAMCESVAIVDHGRLVAGGRLRDMKHASGRRMLRLAVEGELAPSWLAQLPGVAALH